VVPAGSLAAAVLAAVWLIAAPTSAPPAPAAAPGPAVSAAVAPLTVGQRWPEAEVVDAPGTLKDGAAFQPLLYIDASTAVGTAPAPDGRAVRLLVRSAAGERPLQRVAQDRRPQFLGLTAADGVLFWAELTVEPSGPGSTRIWRAPLDGSAAPAVLTAEAGAAVFFESQYDLVVAAGRVHWVAAAPGDTLVTEVRSVPVGGGPVRVDRVAGAFALSAWPWLQTAPGSGSGPLRLHNLDTGRDTVVPTSPVETVVCSPVWCRSIVAGATGATRYDLTRPDGSDRRRVGGGTLSAVLYDVALLDRFEPVSDATGASATTLGLRLLLFDLTDGRLVLLADAAGQVLGRDGVLWWSTGDQEALLWHSLDLRTVPR
jgi:hypothetical protein